MQPERLDELERLRAIQEHLNALRSSGPFMDGLTADGPWWTEPDPMLVALNDAIIAASDRLNAALGDDQCDAALDALRAIGLNHRAF